MRDDNALKRPAKKAGLPWAWRIALTDGGITLIGPDKRWSKGVGAVWRARTVALPSAGDTENSLWAGAAAVPAQSSIAILDDWGANAGAAGAAAQTWKVNRDA